MCGSARVTEWPPSVSLAFWMTAATSSWDSSPLHATHRPNLAGLQRRRGSRKPSKPPRPVRRSFLQNASAAHEAETTMMKRRKARGASNANVTAAVDRRGRSPSAAGMLSFTVCFCCQNLIRKDPKCDHR